MNPLSALRGPLERPCLLLLVLFVACTEREKPGPAPSAPAAAAAPALEGDDLRAIARNILLRPPPLKHKVEAELGGKVVYLGLELDKERLRPGDVLKLTHYWRSLRPVDPGWEIFVRLSDPTGRRAFSAGLGSAIGGRYPAARWKPGQVIRDAQTVTLRGDWSADRVRRIALVATRASEGPKLDGKLEDPVWAKAAPSDPFRSSSGNISPRTEVRVLWDSTSLYLGFQLEDPDILAPPEDCSHDADRVVAVLDARKRALELSVTASGQLCQREAGKGWTPSRALRGRVSIEGTLNGGGRVDRGWSGELAIPWAILGSKAPKGGEELRASFYRVDLAAGEKPVVVSWSEKLEGTVQLGDLQGSSIIRPRIREAQK